MPDYYPNLTTLGNGSDIADVAALPNASYPWFWLVILCGIWVIVTLSGYFREKGMTGRGNLISNMANAARACMVLATLGSLFQIVTLTMLLYVLVFGIFINIIWFFSTNRSF